MMRFRASPPSRCRVPLALLVLLLPALAFAQEPVARCVSIPGGLVGRAAEGKPWTVLKENAPVPAGMLLVALPEATLQSTNGAVSLNMLADLLDRLPEPALECAVTLHGDKDVDLDFRLDRGLASVANLKKQGAARVRVRFHDQFWVLTLKEPKTTVYLGLYGRPVAGMRSYTRDSDKPFASETPPTTEMYVVVAAGEVELCCVGDKEIALTAPPGPALYDWSSVDGGRGSAIRLEKLPDFIGKPPTAEEQQHIQAVNARGKELAAGSREEYLQKALASDNPQRRRMAVVCFGALDDLKSLLSCLDNPNADVRETAIEVLRHWLGRNADQDDKLYEFATQQGKLTPNQAKGLLQLLFGFSEEDARSPELYSTLIAYLRHDRLPVRTLVHWHLVRLAPAGKGIPFDPAGPAEARQKGYEQWKKLIPDGQLPPKPKA